MVPLDNTLMANTPPTFEAAFAAGSTAAAGRSPQFWHRET